MKKKSNHSFSILELLIVVTIMSILALMIFVLVKGAKDSARTVLTESTIKTCKSSMETLYNYVFNEGRKNNIEIYEHPLFASVWPSNKMWTFKDEDKINKGITGNGLMNMINIGSLGVENKNMMTADILYPGSPIPVKTLVDGWGNPILVIRNETPYWIKKETANAIAKLENAKLTADPNDDITCQNEINDISIKVYRDRTKTNLGFYGFHMYKTDSTKLNFYEWNDVGFNHTDSNGISEPSLEVAPMQKDGLRLLEVTMYGKIAIPYNTNDFDFLSVGKDGKIGNLIPNDMKQDRWSKKEQLDVKNPSSGYRVIWTPVSASTVDPDTDNIISYNRYSLEQ